MTNDSPRALAFVHRSFRGLVATSAFLLLLWITVVSLIAVVVHPYLIAALWFLGLGGLFACAGACINTFPGPGRGPHVPHPVRAVFCLLAAGGIGFTLWTVAQPGMVGEPQGLKVLSEVMGVGVVMGILLMLLFSMILVLSGPQTESDRRPREAVRKGIMDLPVQIREPAS